MSCFVCDLDHLSALAYAIERAQRRPRLPKGVFDPDHQRAHEIGRELLCENLLSVNTRYNSNDHEEFVLDKTWARCELDPVALMKSVHCYEYQACEASHWDTSLAKEWCDAVCRDAMRRLPGYEDANWGAPPRPAQPKQPGNERFALFLKAHPDLEGGRRGVVNARYMAWVTDHVSRFKRKQGAGALDHEAFTAWLREEVNRKAGEKD